MGQHAGVVTQGSCPHCGADLELRAVRRGRGDVAAGAGADERGVGRAGRAGRLLSRGDDITERRLIRRILVVNLKAKKKDDHTLVKINK